jgi:hypothetical protein
MMVQRRTLLMADERNPDDRFRFNLTDDGIRRQTRLEDELQADPELAEGSASGSRVAMYAIAIAVILGAVFYGLNNTSIERAGTSSAVQNTAAPSSPVAPEGTRDATPRTNTAAKAAPGVTTGAAPAQPQTPPSSMPTGQDINRAGNPPTNNAAPSK